MLKHWRQFFGKNVRRPMAQAGADFVLGGGQMTGSMIGVGRETKNRTKVLGAQDAVC
jgi:hypothetical protein